MQASGPKGFYHAVFKNRKHNNTITFTCVCTCISDGDY